jgi:hypothetical protein
MFIYINILSYYTLFIFFNLCLSVMYSTERKLPCSMDNYLHANRFDIIIKIVYMHFHVVIKHIPICILLSYTEHLRAWNDFKEFCDDKDPRMNDYYKSCKPRYSNTVISITRFCNPRRRKNL